MYIHEEAWIISLEKLQESLVASARKQSPYIEEGICKKKYEELTKEYKAQKAALEKAIKKSLRDRQSNKDANLS